MLSVAERFIETRATGRVHVVEDVGASGPLVVLVHDVPSQRGVEDVADLFEGLRHSRRVAAVELPGCGASDEAPQPWERRLFVRALAETLLELARRHGGVVDVVGIGLGGEIAARAVLTVPRVVRSVTLIAPTGLGDVSAAARAFGARAVSMASTVLAAFGWTKPALADPWVASDVYDELPVPRLFVPESERRGVATRLLSFWSSLEPRPRFELVMGGGRGVRRAATSRSRRLRLLHPRPDVSR